MQTNGLHVFIFCCAEYEHLLEYCARSINDNIEDNILSYNIVSNKNVKLENYRTILDHDFWKLIDPTWSYGNIYNINWIKQQIFKLNVDRYASGNILIIDAEVLFLNKMRWLENNKINVYTTTNSPYFAPYFEFNKSFLGLEKITDKSFITDTCIFSSDILLEIRNTAEKLHSKTWLEVFDTILEVDKCWVSEFELYGNYIFKYHPDVINMIKTLDHKMMKNDRQQYPYPELIENLKTSGFKDFVSVNIDTHSHTNGDKTQWLTFYQQIKGVDWPECDDESDFVTLPDHIKKECKEKFGYEPKIN